MTRRVVAVVLALIMAAPAIIHAQEQQKREFRAVWFTTVSNIDWPSVKGTAPAVVERQKQEMIEYLDGFKADNFNVVCFQVRSMSDAMYQSSYEPWSSYLTGTRGTAPSWDPLAFIVEQCHKRGMELHCWVNPYRFANGTANTWNTPQDQQLRDSGMLFSYTNSSGTTTTILNPGLPATRERIVNVCREMITKYNVDGLIFDDYFYPSGTPANSSQPDYQLYIDSGSTLSFADWRREQVNQMVRDVYNMVATTRPEVRFGICPAGVAGTAATSASKYNVDPCPTGSDWQYSSLFSDPLAWLNDGVIDYISPQLYWKTNHSTNPFGPLTKWWSYCANHFGRHHYASHNIYFMNSNTNNETSWSEICTQINLSRQYNLDNAPGYNFYSSKYINGPLLTGLGDYLTEHISPKPAIPPALTWKNAPILGTVSDIVHTGSALVWYGTDAHLAKYAVYAVPTSVSLEEAQSQKFGGIKSDYLLGLSYDIIYLLPEDKREGYWYAITIVDGYNNEYEPAFYGLDIEEATKVSLISPINDQVVSWSQTFAWSEAEQATFRIEISDKADFSEITLQVSDLTTNEATIDLLDLEPNKQYYWRVITSQPDCINTPSDEATFITPERETTPVVQLLSPADGARFDDDFTFQATKDEAIESYTLQVARDSEFDDIAITTEMTDNGNGVMVADCVVSTLGKATFHWRVTGSSRGHNDSYSETRSFTIFDIKTGQYEPGYVKKLDIDNDNYETVDEMTLTNEWVRSIKTEYNNIEWESNGLFNRSMTVLDGKIYVSGRVLNSSTADSYLQVFSAETGEHLNDILLPEEVKANYFPVNNVMTDDAGHLLVSNMVLNSNSTPLRLHQVDPATGEVEERAVLYSNSSYRIDHITVTGDVASGDFDVYAASARNSHLLHWIFRYGEQTAHYDTNVTEFYPDDASSFGTAPRVLPLDNNEIIVHSTDSHLAKYNIDTGRLVDSFEGTSGLTPEGTMSNGLATFEFKGRSYLLYGYSDHLNANGYRFMVAGGDNMSYQSMSPMWVMPQRGLGAINSTTASTPCAAVATNDEVKLYVFACGNGLAAYTLRPVPVPLHGDVNLDGVVNVGDVAAVYLCILGTDLTDVERADVNGDGEINTGDVSALYSLILGI